MAACHPKAHPIALGMLLEDLLESIDHLMTPGCMASRPSADRDQGLTDISFAENLISKLF
jgi:hypothetical protein